MEIEEPLAGGYDNRGEVVRVGDTVRRPPRQFTRAVRALLAVSGWHLDWADPLGGSMVCHNDLFPENVVFREGRAVALIDFDMAAPGRRFGRLARAYGVDAGDAVELVDVVFAERAHAIANIRRELEIDNPVWIELWHDNGGDERAAIDDAWLAERRDALIAAIT